MLPLDDLPEATRDQPLGYRSTQGQNPWRTLPRWARWASVAVIAALAVLVVASGATRWQSPSAQPIQGIVAQSGLIAAAPTTGDANADRTAPSSAIGRTLLGHRPYNEAPADDLVALAMNRSIRLRTKAAEQFEAMVEAAQREGVQIVPLSGYRSRSEQEAIFFNVRAARGQDAQTRAEVSAPPGYSEHHTGYAIDVGDANQPNTHLDQSFEDTRAYRWMKNNASRYGFEISFPRNSFQQIAFEPWHWRFMGDIDSLETFYQD